MDGRKDAYIPKVLAIEGSPKDSCSITNCLNRGSPNNLFIKSVSRFNEAVKYLLFYKTDVILLDLSLTQIFCLKDFEFIRKKFPNIPVVVFVDIESGWVGKMALELGAQDCLAKELLDEQFLYRIIHYIVEKQQILNQVDFLNAKLESANSRFEKLDLVDPLTKLFNLRGLQKMFSAEIEKTREHKSSLTAILMGLDNFKQVNDMIGHSAGDLVLKEVSKTLRAVTRHQGTIGRVGGDEFMVLSNTDLRSGMVLAEKMRLAVSNAAMILNAKRAAMTASLGVATVPETTSSLDELLSEVHYVLESGKRTGKNKIFCNEINGKAQNKQEPLNIIFSALHHKRQIFHSVKQPIFSLLDKRKVGYEFLSRISIKELEMPANFFEYCLQSGILTSVDHECFRSCVASAAEVPETVQSHLNLFPSTIINIPPKDLIELLPKNRQKKAYCIEISEQQIIGDPSYLLKPIKEFKDAGIEIAIDDVGFGCSNLEAFIHLEPDIVKIDKKWINGVTRDSLRIKALERLIKLSDVLDAELIAEGIEVEEDLELLKKIGVKYGQGYLLGRPG